MEQPGTGTGIGRSRRVPFAKANVIMLQSRILSDRRSVRATILRTTGRAAEWNRRARDARTARAETDIDGLRRTRNAREVARHREDAGPDATRHPPRHPPGHPARCVPRVTTTDGRSPGSRVTALSSSSQVPGLTDPSPSDVLMMGSPLTVAGAAAALGPEPRTAFPFDPPEEEPSLSS